MRLAARVLAAARAVEFELLAALFVGALALTVANIIVSEAGVLMETKTRGRSRHVFFVVFWPPS